MELEPLDAARERRAAGTKVAPVAWAVRAGVEAGGSARADRPWTHRARGSPAPAGRGPARRARARAPPSNVSKTARCTKGG